MLAVYGVALVMAGCTQAPVAKMLPSSQLDLTGTGSLAGGGHSSHNEVDIGLIACQNNGAYRPWRYIVIHHSAGDTGSAALFDAAHRARGWDELGYHFVIDNGNGGPDGRIEVGPRWQTQKWGAHTGNTPNNEYNNYGIGICLVGDFTNSMPTAAQMASLKQLVASLMAKYDIPPENVIGHRDAPGAHTACPGDRLYNYLQGQLRIELARQLAMKK